MERRCNECGACKWKQVFSQGYPERRRDRDQTMKTLYVCGSCGAEGKHFEQQHEGTEVFSAALR